MVVAMHTFGIIGTILGAFSSYWLAVRFGGIAFRGNRAGVDSEPGKFWGTLKVTTMEKGQKFMYCLLAIGFIFLLLSQVLSCLV